MATACVCVCVCSPTCVLRPLRCAAGVLAYEEMEELVLMSSVSMLSLIPLLTELLSSQLDAHTHTDRAEDRERIALILFKQ